MNVRTKSSDGRTDGHTHTHRYRLYKRTFERTSLAVICIYLKVIRLCLNMRWLPADWLYNSRTDGRTEYLCEHLCWDTLFYWIPAQGYCWCSLWRCAVVYAHTYVLWLQIIATFYSKGDPLFSKLSRNVLNKFTNKYKGIPTLRYCSPT